MKKLVFLILALLVAVPVMAQVQPLGQLPDFYRTGKMLYTVAAQDTFHFEDTQVADAACWQGYETVYVPYNGAMIDKRAYVVGAVLYADSPFSVNPVFRNGDAQTYHTIVDTVGGPESPNRGDAATAGAVYLTTRYPCYTVIRGDLDELRVDPTASDTLFCVPLLDWDAK